MKEFVLPIGQRHGHRTIVTLDSRHDVGVRVYVSRGQAQAVVDGLICQGIEPLPRKKSVERPSEGKPAAVACPRCGGLRVELRWFTGGQVYIISCGDCEAAGERRIHEGDS